MDKDVSVDNLNKYVEERLNGNLTPISKERLAMTGKSSDFERLNGHGKKGSVAVTELVKDQPIIGRETAFSKRLPEINRVADEV
jgi:hypothetical protein